MSQELHMKYINEYVHKSINPFFYMHLYITVSLEMYSVTGGCKGIAMAPIVP